MTTTDLALAHATADRILYSFSNLESIVRQHSSTYWTANDCTPAIELMQDNHHALKGENGTYGYAGQWGEVLKQIRANDSQFPTLVGQLISLCNRLENTLFNSGDFKQAKFVQKIKNDLWKVRHEVLELN